MWEINGSQIGVAINALELTMNRDSVSAFIHKQRDFLSSSFRRQISIFVTGEAIFNCLGLCS
jgi:hypothetical protein